MRLVFTKTKSLFRLIPEMILENRLDNLLFKLPRYRDLVVNIFLLFCTRLCLVLPIRRCRGILLSRYVLTLAPMHKYYLNRHVAMWHHVWKVVSMLVTIGEWKEEVGYRDAPAWQKCLGYTKSTSDERNNMQGAQKYFVSHFQGKLCSLSPYIYHSFSHLPSTREFNHYKIIILHIFSCFVKTKQNKWLITTFQGCCHRRFFPQ